MRLLFVENWLAFDFLNIQPINSLDLNNMHRPRLTTSNVYNNIHHERYGLNNLGAA